MDYTWILVADRTRARIVAKPNVIPTNGQGWKELDPLVYPEARLPERALTTDKPGRSFDRKRSGRHAMAAAVSAKDEAAERFAKSVAKVLEKGRTSHLYQHLILVAEPGFLGTLQASLSEQTAKRVIERIPKDLTTRPSQELTKDLQALLRPSA